MAERLINADELIKLIPPEEHIARCIVANAPTVEAIPIEWLKKFRNGLDSLSECKLMEAIDTIIDAYKAERKEE